MATDACRPTNSTVDCPGTVGTSGADLRQALLATFRRHQPTRPQDLCRGCREHWPCGPSFAARWMLIRSGVPPRYWYGQGTSGDAGPEGGTLRPGASRAQLTLTAVSSMSKEVANDESSVPVNRRVTVWPM